MTVYNSAGDSEGTSFGQSGEKIGFYGTTPIVQASATAAGTDAATTQALANGIRTALINLGLWA